VLWRAFRGETDFKVWEICCVVTDARTSIEDMAEDDLIIIYRDKNISNGIFGLAKRSINSMEEAEARQASTRKKHQ